MLIYGNINKHHDTCNRGDHVYMLAQGIKLSDGAIGKKKERFQGTVTVLVNISNKLKWY